MSGVSKKRKRKSQGAEKKDREATAEEEDEGPEGDTNVQMTARTLEEKQKEQDQKIMLVKSLDAEQFDRYEAWRSSKLADSVVKRVGFLRLLFEEHMRLTSWNRSSIKHSPNRRPRR